MTALHMTCMDGNVPATKVLIKNGADLNAQHGNFQMAPLHYACRDGHLEIVQLLVEGGADINIQAKRGKTPLAQAQESKRDDIVKYLKEQGAK